MIENIQNTGIYLDLLDTTKTSYDRYTQAKKMNELFAIATLKASILLRKKIVLSQTQLFDSSVINELYRDNSFKTCISEGLIGVSLYKADSLRQAITNTLEKNLHNVNLNGKKDEELGKLFRFGFSREFQKDSLKDTVEFRELIIDCVNPNSVKKYCDNEEINEWMHNIIEISAKIEEKKLDRYYKVQSTPYTLGKCIERLTNSIDQYTNQEVKECLRYLNTQGMKSNVENSRSFYYAKIEEYVHNREHRDKKLKDKIKQIMDMYYNLVVGSSINNVNVELSLEESSIDDMLSKILNETVNDEPDVIIKENNEAGNYIIDRDMNMEALKWSEILECIKYVEKESKGNPDKAFKEYYKSTYKNKFSISPKGVVMCSGAVVMPNALSMVTNSTQVNLLLASTSILAGIFQLFGPEYYSKENEEIRHKRKIFKAISKQLK